MANWKKVKENVIKMCAAARDFVRWGSDVKQAECYEFSLFSIGKHIYQLEAMMPLIFFAFAPSFERIVRSSCIIEVKKASLV